MISPPIVDLVCPVHHTGLGFNLDLQEYQCYQGCRYPVVRQIPRFTTSEDYAKAFGAQWKAFRRTQLDSYTGLSITRDRLTRCLGDSLDIVNGKKVLEAGCGAGRFTELLLNSGAKLFACDLSTAVEACYQNIGESPNLFLCQCSLLNLPVRQEQFDIVICLGVIQHTPNPEQTMISLCAQVAPDGLLVMDHYTHGYPVTPIRVWLRRFLTKHTPDFSIKFCRVMVVILWPFHRLLWCIKDIPLLRKVRKFFLYWSPIVDYHDAYTGLKPDLLRAWAILDTHDTLTDQYKHLRSAEEITETLRSAGMSNIETVYAGNGVEARARKFK